MCEYNKYFKEVFVESDNSLSEIDLDYPFHSPEVGKLGDETRNYIEYSDEIMFRLHIFVDIGLLINKLEWLKTSGSEYVYVEPRETYGYELTGVKLVEDDSLKEKLKLKKELRDKVNKLDTECNEKIKKIREEYKEKIDKI